MEHLKISKLLNGSTILKFVTRKWIKENDLSTGQYSVNKNKRLKTLILRSNLCDYIDTHIFVKEKITLRGTNNVNTINKKLTFKNNAPLIVYS